MRLSKHEKIRSKQERAFHRAILERLASSANNDDAAGPIKRGLARTFKFLNSPVILTALGLSISFGVFYHHTYVACVADGRKAWQDYVAVRMELFQRQAQIATDVFDAKSIKELRDALARNKSFDRQFREDSTTELQARQILQTAAIDTSGSGPDLARVLLDKVDNFQKNKLLFFNGILDDRTISDELPTLKQLAIGVLQVNAYSFMAELRHVGQIECVPANVLALMWGEQPITVRKFDAGSFLEREKIHQQVEAERNHLAPMQAPPAFPATTYGADVSAKSQVARPQP